MNILSDTHVHHHYHHDQPPKAAEQQRSWSVLPIAFIAALLVMLGLIYGFGRASAEPFTGFFDDSPSNGGCYDGNQPSYYQLEQGIVVCRAVDLTPAMRAMGLRAFDEALANLAVCAGDVDALVADIPGYPPASRAWWSNDSNFGNIFCETAGLEVGQSLCADWWGEGGAHIGIDPAKSAALCKLLQERAFHYGEYYRSGNQGVISNPADPCFGLTGAQCKR